MTVPEILKVLESFKEIISGAVSGAVAYLFDYLKARREGNENFIFRPSSMMINIILGMFVAYYVGTAIPIETVGRDAIIAGCGFAAYPILLLAQSRIAKTVLDKFPIIKDKEK